MSHPLSTPLPRSLGSRLAARLGCGFAVAFAIVLPAAAASAQAAAPSNAGPQIGQTAYFAYAMPPGWQLGENGPFALTLVAPDRQALTVMVGNSGLPVQYPALRFATDKLMAMRPAHLQLGPPQPTAPAAGFSQAVAFEVAFVLNGQPWRGLARVSVAPAYDTATMALNAAFASAAVWPQVAGWLPQVAAQVAATNGGAFGMRGVMQQNLRNSAAFGEAARNYRDWSQRNWQQVTDQRQASQDRRNTAVRENLGGVHTYRDPYGNPPRELPQTHRYWWTDRQGRTYGTDDPGVNPNAGSTSEWRRMERVMR